MNEEQLNMIFEFDLKEKGERLVFSTPEELQTWNSQELSKWQWLQQTSDVSNLIYSQQHQALHNQVQVLIQQWRTAIQQKNSELVKNVNTQLGNIFNNFYINRAILNSTSPDALWLFQIRDSKGIGVAAGAYVTLLNRNFQGGISQPAVLEGVIAAFLYKNEIDWTASAQQEAFNNLRVQYSENLAKQDVRFKEIEDRNESLNDAFQKELTDKSASIDKLYADKSALLEQLHGEQTSNFNKVIGENVEKLQGIELAYDQKLALQKPVKYWRTKELFHGKRAIWFGVTALCVGLLLLTLMGILIYNVIGDIPQNANPKHWQIGLLIAAAFFSIWLTRILVRLFLSHLHLSTDAAERRMMILTYLSIAREGSQFTQKDKALILQHIFRTASDGLVKDDAAPPTLFEMFSRKS